MVFAGACLSFVSGFSFFLFFAFLSWSLLRVDGNARDIIVASAHLKGEKEKEKRQDWEEREMLVTLLTPESQT
jgi:hypothetical protein